MKKIRRETHKNLSIYIVTAFIIISFFTSCTTQRIAYFKDIPDTLHNQKVFVLDSFSSPKVKSDDILNITIQTIDPNANQVLNQGNLPILSGAASAGNGLQTAISGYLVNKEGYIHMPYVGNVHVSGSTTDEIRDSVLAKIGFYFKDPVVNVRFANFRVTVLGEVKNPSSFIIPNEKPTVFDAIGLAGDITIYGRKDNVMLMRDEAGKKEIVRLDLDSSSSIRSPFFFLRPNDVIYIEPTASRVESTDAYRLRNITLIAAGLSLATIIIARLIN